MLITRMIILGRFKIKSVKMYFKDKIKMIKIQKTYFRVNFYKNYCNNLMILNDLDYKMFGV